MSFVGLKYSFFSVFACKKQYAGVKFVCIQTLSICLTYTIVISIFAINTTNTKIQRSKSQYLNIISQIVSGKTYENIDELKQYVKSDTSTITSIIPFSDLYISTVFNQTAELANIWSEMIDFSKYYILSINGFENIHNKTDFSDDIAEFLKKLPAFIEKAKKLLNSTTWINVLASLLSQKKVITLFSTIGKIIDTLELLSDNKNEILKIIGHNGNQYYTLFSQNIGESRPTGGFTGSYINIELFKGKMRISKSQSIYNFDGGSQNDFITHPASYMFSLNSRGETEFKPNIHDSNYFNCFRDTASFVSKQIEDNSNGGKNDGIIFVNPAVFMALDGDIAINVDGLIINKTNFLDEVERITSYETKTPDNPKAKISTIFTKLFEEIMKRPKISLATILGSEILNRNIQIWIKDNKAELFSKQIGLSQSGTCQNQVSQQVISPLISNISGDKRGLITENRFNIYQESQDSNSVRYHITYKQILPNQPVLRRGLNTVSPLTFFGFQLPKEAFDLKISSPQKRNMGLYLPYIKQLNKNLLKSTSVTQPQIQEILNSYHEEDQGFVYNQLDTSKVLGLYLSDQETTTVDTTFSLPKTSNSQNLRFIGQSGLMTPSLSLGREIVHRYDPDKRLIVDGGEIQRGVNLISR